MEFSQPISISRAKTLNPLSLAFVGDAVQTLFVRQNLCKSIDAKACKLHLLASGQVNSVAQSKTLDAVEPLLNQDELDIVRRARNTKYHTTPSHSTLADYKKASGLEAVLGYLYLTGQYDRLRTLLDATRQNSEELE